MPGSHDQERGWRVWERRKEGERVEELRYMIQGLKTGRRIKKSKIQRVWSTKI